jgi:hypothetical protein
VFDPDDILDRPPNPDKYRALHDWLYRRLGLSLAVEPVCPGHSSPYQILHHKYKHKPRSSIVHGPRGGGKSMMSGIFAHLRCRFNPHYKVKILGGSKQQSAQVYEAIDDIVYQGIGPDDGDPRPIDALLKEKAIYKNGSSVTMLAASSKSARGPHAPHLILDEVEEQNADVMQGAIGIVQEYRERGFPPIVEMLSTWHKVGGLMEKKMESAREHGTPVFKFCIFEVMEKCPTRISGPKLENCPSCPIYKHCHADRFNDKRAWPRAKRSNGHLTLETILQKVEFVSERAFEADYLCLGPRVEGVWYPNYHDELNVCAIRGEYNPKYDVHVSIDYGVCTGATFFQVKKSVRDGRHVEDVAVFADYYAESRTAEENAGAIREIARTRCRDRMDRITMDSASKSREGVGTTGRAEYYKAGLQDLKFWPKVRNKVDSLAIVDSFIKTASGSRHLFVHPRCKMTRQALLQYRRAKVGGVWLDHPQDPQHPEEEMVDALSGGLNTAYPHGRVPIYNRNAIWTPAHSVG